MSNGPERFKYTKTHEWAELTEDGTITVGITQHAQDLLGDMVFVEVPPIGRRLKAGEECAVVESVKAASDVYSPVSGEVIETNTMIVDNPELVNKDPYGQGWLLRLRPSAPEEMDDLMDTTAYAEFVAGEAH